MIENKKDQHHDSSMNDKPITQPHQQNADRFYRQAQVQAEKNGDSELSAQLILKALRQERLLKLAGPQVIQIISKGWRQQVKMTSAKGTNDKPLTIQAIG